MNIRILTYNLLFLLLASCTIQKTEQANSNSLPNTLPEIKNYHRPYAIYTKDNKFLVKYELNPKTQELVQDNTSRAITRYDYSKSGQLLRIAYLNKDSTYLDFAFLNFKYDSLDRISSWYYSANGGGKFKPNWLVSYNDKGLIDNVVAENHIKRFGTGGPGMSKFTYDKFNRIIKEEFFNCDGESAIEGEQGFKYISYVYNEKKQIIKEICHYTGTGDPDAPAENKWLNEYTYDLEGKLILYRYKYRMESKKFNGTYYFKYDVAKNLYGSSKDSSNIILNVPYQKLNEIFLDKLISGNFSKIYTHLKFKN